MKVRELIEFKNPPLSPRNSIACPHIGTDADRLVEIDTLYEFCDAALNSWKEVHEAFRHALRQRGNAHAQVTKAFIPFVAREAQASVAELPKVQDPHSHMLVAYRVACDWISEAKRQTLLEHQQAQRAGKAEA